MVQRDIHHRSTQVTLGQHGSRTHYHGRAVGTLDERVVIVTGAGRGIGEAIARRFAAEGAALLLNDLGVALDGSGADAAPAKLLADELTASGARAIANVDDVADHEAAEALVRSAVEHFGKLDVVVNTAGILRDRMIFNMPADDWDAVIRVHLRGAFNICKHSAVYWRELRDPAAHHRIVNFTSVSGLHGAAGQPNYAAAKLGIVGLTYSCANALGRYGVTANAISPLALTRMSDSIPDDRRRAGTEAAERSPDNVVPAVAYLASTASDWLTGQVIAAGGYRIGLYNKPQVISQVVFDKESFGVEQAGLLMEQAFRPLVADEH
jgi:NAD(P)-dependent dehydrogenase (short-subunit alcohol dehydrogenase family)